MCYSFGRFSLDFVTARDVDEITTETLQDCFKKIEVKFEQGNDFMFSFNQTLKQTYIWSDESIGHLVTHQWLGF